ncbi:Low temperature requirement protein LtrA [Micromonospora echinaurantiaca]|uniref:Low temperature requirement protein LtrA n=1 Tax=Micromonospora echinaurantiaca TaxID=47857 RepID=A0A1C5J2T9_9ACTN|nr:low temperature requirement protein A [Micromonospora echinaurantiaca]SCG64763.1 Low temperature requirement protein LtrA [Micromonospora echinaurantiaca]
MTTGRVGGLLRGPGDPRATYLELFFDLAFIFALAQLSYALLTDLSLSGAVDALVLLLAVWWVWFTTAWITELFDPQRPEIQALTIAIMIGVLVMAVALPDAFGGQGLVFAGAYVAIHLGRELFLVVLLRGHELRCTALRGLFWFGVSALPWLAGALAPGTARGILWALAVGLDYAAYVFRHPTPGIGRTPIAQLPSVAEHLAERYRQFFIIALGELILVTGLTLRGTGFTAYGSIAFLVSITTTVLLWRIYIYRAGELLSAAIDAAPDRARLARSVSYTHLAMVAGTVFTAVGAELVIAHPLGHSEPAWGAVLLGGPALFLAGRAAFEYTVFARLSRGRLIGLLAAVALIPAMRHVPPLPSALTATAVLAGVAASDVARARGRPPEVPSPPT